MNVFQRRRLRKVSRQILHEAAHARNMRGDIADPGDLKALREAEAAVQDAWKDPSGAGVNQALEALSERSRKVLPSRPYAAVRENVEILAVAIIVAMGFRTYFVQPFKIPTGSMQPTLYGITVQVDQEPHWTDMPPFRYAKFLLTGQRYIQVKAKADGYVGFARDAVRREEFILVYPNTRRGTRGVRHKAHSNLPRLVQRGQRVDKGTVLARGMLRSGDHIFVNKVKYNFVKPKRGDIVVFRTEHIDHPDIQKTDHYIKRLVGLPGETVSIDDRHLVINGKRITEPYCFQRLLNEDGYVGYTYARTEKAPRPFLAGPSDRLQLTPDQFLPFGDNTRFSLDGRYFGGVPTRDILGPAFAVYWPFGERWGRVR
jgi:signal peptidase I